MTTEPGERDEPSAPDPSPTASPAPTEADAGDEPIPPTDPDPEGEPRPDEASGDEDPAEIDAVAEPAEPASESTEAEPPTSPEPPVPSEPANVTVDETFDDLVDESIDPSTLALAAADRSAPRRSWTERFAVAGTFVSALVCLLVAAALILGYQVVRSRNIAEFENPAEAASEIAAPLVPTATNPAATNPATTPPTSSAETTTSVAASTTSIADDDGEPPTPAVMPNTSRPTTTRPAAAPPSTSRPPTTTRAVVTTTVVTTTTTTTTTTVAPAPTFPDADPAAKNFLVTGADNGACIDPDSPYAGGFGDRTGMGERSDTIMLIRVDPSADRVAVLSFPRDLWVKIAGSGNMQRINAAYERDRPQRLADTIYDNFGIPIDHFIQVDFCAFKTLVDSVGGVNVPFQFPTRDRHTGLLVEEPGCVNLSGEAALAYVRSRYYEYEDPAGSGDWSQDGTSDLGRISRQQDFLRRVLSSVLDKGPLNPSVARGLIDAATNNIVTDADLTVAKMLEFAGVMNDVAPESITTYQIAASGKMINGNAVLEPNIGGENMQKVLAMFRGEISLADAPIPESTSVDSESVVATEPVPGSDGVTVDTSAGVVSSEITVTTEVFVETTAPPGPEEYTVGVVPPRDLTC